MKSGSLTTLALIFVFFTNPVMAADTQVGASCYVQLNDPRNIQGENIDLRLPIASVSKLVTSYWAIKEKTVDYRFHTIFYVSKVDNNLYDLHIQGSRDPYFGAERFHYAISELNKRGITKIRNLTFDENFKFYWSIDDKDDNQNLAHGFYLPRDPVPEKVKSQLKAFAKLTADYQETFNRAAKAGIKMLEKVDFTVDSIEFLGIKDFMSNQAMTEAYVIYSTPLANLLKEMNRNSNNHAANQIFEHLEAEQRFSQFIFKNLNLDTDSILMRNGSGDRVDAAGGAQYNEASCSAMLKIMMDMYSTLKTQNSSITKVATVIGTNQGTATGLYNSDKTFDNVVAKTGTINAAVTLGGMASTEKGLIFFMFNMKTNGTASSFSAARATIRKKLNDLINKFDGGVRLKANSFSFISFDNNSFSELETSGVKEKP